MTPKAKGWTEERLSEDPAIELLQHLGYAYVAPEDLDSERHSFKETILTERLSKALRKLNPWLSDSNVSKAIKDVTHVPAASLAEANEKVYVTLTYGTTVAQDRGDGRQSYTVRYFNFENPKQNDLLVTRQYRVLGSKKHIIPDVVVFVNGIPLGVI